MTNSSRVTKVDLLVFGALLLASVSWAQSCAPIAEKIAKAYGLDSLPLFQLWYSLLAGSSGSRLPVNLDRLQKCVNLAGKIFEQDMKMRDLRPTLTHCSDIVPDHIYSKGMGSSRRDDHPDYVQAAQRRCNLETGSSTGL